MHVTGVYAAVNCVRGWRYALYHLYVHVQNYYNQVDAKGGGVGGGGGGGGGGERYM